MAKDDEVKRVLNLINKIHSLSDEVLLSSSTTTYEEYKKELLRIINLDSNIIEYELNEGEIIFLNVLEALNEKYSYCIRKDFREIILKLIAELKEVVYPEHELKDYPIAKFRVVERITYDPSDE